MTTLEAIVTLGVAALTVLGGGWGLTNLMMTRRWKREDDRREELRREADQARQRELDGAQLTKAVLTDALARAAADVQAARDEAAAARKEAKEKREEASRLQSVLYDERVERHEEHRECRREIDGLKERLAEHADRLAQLEQCRKTCEHVPACPIGGGNGLAVP